MSNHTASNRSQLWAKLRRTGYRRAFSAAHLASNVSMQIYNMRLSRGWTQKDLADAAGMAQSRISLIEGPSYDRFSLSTLKRIAEAFDVALLIRFVPFSELLDRTLSIMPDRVVAPSFETEDHFAEVKSNSQVSTEFTESVVILDKYRSTTAATADSDQDLPVANSDTITATILSDVKTTSSAAA
jgi:transcriptional regulator with XRE-family HTH domain